MPHPSIRATAAPAHRKLVSVGYPVLYWKDQELILHEPLSGERLVVGTFAVQLLHFLKTPRSMDEVQSEFSKAPAPSLRRAISDLLSYRLIAHELSPGSRPPHQLDAWGALAPEASFYHFATRNPKIPHGKQLQELEDASDEAPALQTVQITRKRMALNHRVSSAPEGTLPAVLLARRSWRVFGKAAVSNAALAQLLHLTFGVQSWARSPGGTPAKLKTSPSAGARHPIDCYVAAVNVEGIAPGLYRYADEVHALETVRRGLTRARLERYLGRQWWFRDAAAAIFFVGRVRQITSRYAHPRAYRLLLLDAGHLCQTFCLTATWLGLAPFCTAALADSMIERDLGLDGINDVVLYAAGVGTRPAGGYRQWPEHDPDEPYVRPSRRRH
jgi:SagB-type dehydrogenase family enzyme